MRQTSFLQRKLYQSALAVAGVRALYGAYMNRSLEPAPAEPSLEERLWEFIRWIPLLLLLVGFTYLIAVFIVMEPANWSTPTRLRLVFSAAVVMWAGATGILADFSSGRIRQVVVLVCVVFEAMLLEALLTVPNKF